MGKDQAGREGFPGVLRLEQWMTLIHILET